MGLNILSLRSGHGRSRRPSSVALYGEQLEARLTPKGPSLTYSLVQVTDPGVVVTGRIIGTYAGGGTVNFTGALTTSVTADAGGYFSFTANGNYLGTISGVATDSIGQSSSVINRTLSSLTPTFASFTATQGANNVWTFSGVIANENVYNQTITFSGLSSVNGVTTTTNATGAFSVNIQLASGETGTVQAEVADCWNLLGDAYYTI